MFLAEVTGNSEGKHGRTPDRMGHFQPNCPLNCNGPAQLMGSCPSPVNNHRPHPNIANINLNVILFTEGLINESPKFLLDSGAVVPVIMQEYLPKHSHNDITETKTSAVAAN